eukprot:XP_003391483.1 PREDICTED: uncharacterized protein LOC100637736 [Amphimedon queenslandica]
MPDPARLCATIPAEYSGLRADQALAMLFPEHSRSRIARWIRSGAALLDGARSSPKAKVVGGEKVDILCKGSPDESLAARPGDLAIVHEDSEALVIDKPPGLVVHPGAGNLDHTLLNRLIFFDPSLRSIPRCGIVHRLDKDTSGLMVIARTLTAHTRLVEMLRRREVERIYEAVTLGIPPAKGTIDAAIARDRRRRTRMAIDAAGKPAITHYRRLQRYSRNARMELRLESGRTHQIRVHLAHIGYPILGDAVYGGRHGRDRFSDGPSVISRDVADAGDIDPPSFFPRQALHAKRLSFAHPSTKETMVFESEPPADMQGLIESLASENASRRPR